MDLIEIARLEEGRHAAGLAEVALEARPFAGGTAGRGPPGSWINNAVGAGLNGPVTVAELDDLIRWYADKGIEPRLEVCPFVDPSLLRALEERAFSVKVFETLFCRDLDATGTVRPIHDAPPELRVSIVDPGNID